MTAAALRCVIGLHDWVETWHYHRPDWFNPVESGSYWIRCGSCRKQPRRRPRRRIRYGGTIETGGRP